MKKNYISPKVDIYEVKVSNLLSGSPGIQSGNAEAGSSSSPVNFGRGNDGDDW